MAFAIGCYLFNGIWQFPKSSWNLNREVTGSRNIRLVQRWWNGRNSNTRQVRISVTSNAKLPSSYHIIYTIHIVPQSDCLSGGNWFRSIALESRLSVDVDPFRNGHQVFNHLQVGVDISPDTDTVLLIYSRALIHLYDSELLCPITLIRVGGRR